MTNYLQHYLQCLIDTCKNVRRGFCDLNLIHPGNFLKLNLFHIIAQLETTKGYAFNSLGSWKLILAIGNSL